MELTTTGASPSAPALLKSLEETPTRTIFLLTAEDVPPALDTVASRCVELKLKGLSEEGIAEVLIREGATALAARAAASAANGNLRRARILGRDDELAQRIAQWRSVPDRLNGTPATSAALATEIARALDDAIAPLQQMQEEEMALRVQESRQMGQRSVANRRDTEAQFKREQRRFRIDELRFGLTALTNVYRDRMVESLEGSELGDARDRVPRRRVDPGDRRLERGVAAPLVQHRRDAVAERPHALVDGVLRVSESLAMTHQLVFLLAPG